MYTRIKGIYTITCKQNERVYVGKSMNIKVRWSRHRYDFRDGIHWNKEMQADYDKYGGLHNFEFKIIKEMPLNTSDSILCELEKEYIKKLDTFENGYNETLGGIGNSGKKFSEEARKNMGMSHKGFKHNEESKKKYQRTKRN